jgi:hypothetical protein
MKLHDDGSLKKDFSVAKRVFNPKSKVQNDKAEIDYALQMVVLGQEFEDPRFAERPPPPVFMDYPMGSTIIFLGNVHYGSLAEVVGYGGEPPNSVSIKLRVSNIFFLWASDVFIEYLILLFDRNQWTRSSSKSSTLLVKLHLLPNAVNDTCHPTKLPKLLGFPL